MTNSIAIGLGILICGAIVVDLLVWGGDGIMFLSRKGIELLDWMAVWR